MKMDIRTLLLIVVSSVVLSNPAKADDDRPISVDKMPLVAQEFIKKHFPGKTVALAKQEGRLLEKNYDVIFIDGNKVEFNRSGEWTNVDCEYSSVPESIVPAPIAGYIRKNFPGVAVKQIEKDKRRYEVELANGVDLTFNMSGELVDVDL